MGDRDRDTERPETTQQENQGETYLDRDFGHRHTHTLKHTHTHTHMRTHTQTHTQNHTHTKPHTHSHMHACTHTNTHTHTAKEKGGGGQQHTNTQNTNKDRQPTRHLARFVDTFPLPWSIIVQQQLLCPIALKHNAITLHGSANSLKITGNSLLT